MRKIKCDEILNKNDYISLNDKDFEEQVLRYCLDKMNEYELATKDVSELKEYPSKKYEIFEVEIHGAPRIFVLDTTLIEYDDEIEEKELYYSKLIAKRICENMKFLKEDAVMGNPETESMYLEEIEEKKQKIEEYKVLDEDEYNLDRFTFNSLKDTSILEDYEAIASSKHDLEKENEELKQKLKESQDRINELSKKLKISLDDIENNRKKLKMNNKSIFEKILDMFKN